MDSELDLLGERIAEQAAHLDAAMHRLLTDLREFDTRGGWHIQGAMSCAHWLAWRVGWDLGTARQRVRVASRLGEFSQIDDALRRGEVSYSKVRAMMRVATPENEFLLLEYSRLMTAAQLEKLCRKYALVQRHDKDASPWDDEYRRYVRRRDTEDGMVKIEAVLHPEEAEMVWNMLNHAAIQLTNSPASVSGSAETSGPTSGATAGAGNTAMSPAAEVDAFQANGPVTPSAAEAQVASERDKPDRWACSAETTAEVIVTGDHGAASPAGAAARQAGSVETPAGEIMAAGGAVASPAGAAAADDTLASPAGAAARQAGSVETSAGEIVAAGGAVASSAGAAAADDTLASPSGAAARQAGSVEPADEIVAAGGAVASPAGAAAADGTLASPAGAAARQAGSVETSAATSSLLSSVETGSACNQQYAGTGTAGSMVASWAGEADTGAAGEVDTGAAGDGAVGDDPVSRLTNDLDAVGSSTLTQAPAPAASGQHSSGSVLHQQVDARRRAFCRADALVSISQAYLRGERPTRTPIDVTLTIPAEVLRNQSASEPPRDTATDVSDPVSVGELGDSLVSKETARRLSCDAGVVEVVTGSQGAALSVGRKRRTIAGALKRALHKRDQHCTFPGCTNRVFLEGHHIKHWADGGDTSLGNCALMCSFHHRYVHEYGYSIELGPDQRPVFRDPRGRPVTPVPSIPMPPDLGWPSLRMVNAPLNIDAKTIACGWDGKPVRYGACVEHLVMADGLT